MKHSNIPLNIFICKCCHKEYAVKEEFYSRHLYDQYHLYCLECYLKLLIKEFNGYLKRSNIETYEHRLRIELNYMNTKYSVDNVEYELKSRLLIETL